MKKRTTAIVLFVLMVAAAIGIGQTRKQSYLTGPTPSIPLESGLDTGKVSRFLDDQAGLLSKSAAQTVLSYDAN